MFTKSCFLFLLLLCVSSGLCDDVSDRGDDVLDKYYKHYIDIDKQSSNRIRVNWAYAALSLYNDKDITQKADRVLFETLEPQKTIFTQTGSEGHDIYWETVILSRMMNCKEITAKLSDETKHTINTLLWDFVYNFDKPGHSEPSLEKINTIYNSDNHDMIHRGVYLMAAQALKDDPQFKDKKYADGLTAAAHYAIWRKNLMEYFKFRASTGVNVEFGSTCYAGVYLHPIFSIYDCCQDKQLADQAGKFIDLFFADVSQEVLNGVRGGAKVRMYKNAHCCNYQADKLLYYNYILTGKPKELDRLFPTDCFGAAQSDYRLPQTVKELMVDTKAKGAYVYKSNRLAQGGHVLGNKYGLGDALAPIYTAETQSGLLRYTYATPSYLLGTFTIDETKTYMLINSQNQWMALTTAAKPSSRIVVNVTPTSDERTGYRDLQAVQYKNCAMFRKQLAAEDGGLLRLFVSNDFEMTDKDGTLFFENDSVYAAVMCIQHHDKTGYEIEKTDFGPGRFVTFNEPNVYFVLEVADKKEYENLNEFSEYISGNDLRFENNYDEIIYDSKTCKCSLEMFTDVRMPLVNGKPVDVRPAKVYDSPYMQSNYGSGVVTVTGVEGENLVLDFNY
ncbi:MAG: hypothetical protein ACIAQZ_06925 [Sedimentisphaeraceae bacterium JB056]